MPTLTSLDNVKAWIDVSNTDDDALLTRLIAQASAFIAGYIQRPFLLRKTYTDTFVANGQSKRMLKNYPVVTVSGVTIQGVSISASNMTACGYWLEPDDGMPPGRAGSVYLNDYSFKGPCQITYDAGFCIVAEPQTAAPLVQVDAPYGSWAADNGVTLANGTPLVLVADTPSAGQYAASAAGYVFADTGPVLISYSYIPADLEQACIEIVAERYNYSDRIGQKSVNTQGEIVSFDLSDMSPYVKSLLNPFRRVVPV